ncbi:MAG: sugar phosphate isomerase/epimerase family protein [Candidatus Brocadiia bacterium]
MLFGVNLMLFGDTVDENALERFALIREIGFDGVEVPVFEPDAVDVGAIRSAARRHGLALTASGALPPGSRLCGDDAEARRAAENYLRHSIRVVAGLGATVFCGPFYKPVGQTDPDTPPEVQRAEVAAALRPLADEAHEQGVALAVEPLNRFETDLLNTVEDGVEFIRDVGSPGAGLLLDTFHMHIEEKDAAGAVRWAAETGTLAHFHASENDRGVPGTGQVRWGDISDALRDTDYDDWVVLETFNQGNQAIRRAVSCWRPFYENEEQFMREGLRFVRSRFGR